MRCVGFPCECDPCDCVCNWVSRACRSRKKGSGRRKTQRERKGKGRESKEGTGRQAGRQGGRVRTVDAGNGSDSEALGGGLSELSSFITSEQFARKRRTKLQASVVW